MPKVISPKEVALALTEHWSPRVIGEVDDVYVKVAAVKGTLAWHSHENEDELFLILKGHLRIEMEDGAVELDEGEMFLILKGHLRIEMEDGAVELDEGEMFVVPKGVRHNPVADEECHLLLIERKSTRHTGDVNTEKTRSLEEQLRPV